MKKIILLTLIFSHWGYGKNIYRERVVDKTKMKRALLNHCVKHSEDFHTMERYKPIHPDCFDMMLYLAKPYGVEENKAINLLAFAFKNQLHWQSLDDKGKVVRGNLLGSEPGLEEVHALDIDEENERIIVLANEPKQVYTFNKLSGSVEPIKRIIDHKNLEGASNLGINPYTQHIYVLFKEVGQIKIYSADADLRPNIKEELKPKVLKVIDRFQGANIVPLDIAVNKDRKEVYLLGEKALYIWSWDDEGQLSEVGKLDTSDITAPHRVNYDSSSKKITITNEAGATTEFSY